MSQPKTHRERAERAAEVIDRTPHRPHVSTLAVVIARETFPTELVAAARACEHYLVERGIESRGTVGRTEILPALRSAIALYPESEKETAS